MFRNCRFLGNEAMFGGAVAGGGCGSLGCLFENCEFTDNYSPFGPAAIQIGDAQPGDILRLENCILARNVGAGPALQLGTFSQAEIVGCTFHANESSLPGSGVIEWYGTTPLVVENSIFSDGKGSLPVLCRSTGTVAMTCSDAFGNEAGDYVNCLAGLDGVGGNFSANPLFCNAATGNLTLDAQSPCLPGNHPSGVPCDLIGALGAGCNVVSVPPGVPVSTWGRLKSEFR